MFVFFPSRREYSEPTQYQRCSKKKTKWKIRDVGDFTKKKKTQLNMAGPCALEETSALCRTGKFHKQKEFRERVSMVHSAIYAALWIVALVHSWKCETRFR